MNCSFLQPTQMQTPLAPRRAEEEERGKQISIYSLILVFQETSVTHTFDHTR